MIAENSRRNRAFILAISNYRSNNLPALDFCNNDGEEMYKVLRSLGYNIQENHKLIGEVKWEMVSGDIVLAYYPQFVRSKYQKLYTARLMDEGEKYLIRREPSRAIEYYDKVIEINPRYAKPHYSKGRALSSLEKYEEAIESFSKAIEINPKYDDAWYEKGNVLVNLGRYEEAIESYNKTTDINPRHVKALNLKRRTQEKIESKLAPIDYNTNRARPKIIIKDIHCSEQGNVTVEFDISGINHGSKAITLRVRVLSPNGTIIHQSDIPVPKDAPDCPCKMKDVFMRIGQKSVTSYRFKVVHRTATTHPVTLTYIFFFNRNRLYPMNCIL